MDRGGSGERPDPSLAYLELYKLTVEMADRVTARRATTNSFFITLNVALVAVIGFIRPKDPSNGTLSLELDRFGSIYISSAGVVLAAAWLMLLSSFRRLNWAKFKVIGEMEKRLPAEPYNEEWRLLRPDSGSRRLRGYKGFGTVEQLVPCVFLAIYLAAIVRFLV